MNYVVATIKDWNIEAFKQTISKYDGNWFLITSQKKLTLKRLRGINPTYIFFPHWSWIVDKRILNEFKCVCFHETDLPFGRGGSPIQNLIARGFKETKVSAFLMSEKLDAGDVLLKKGFSLHGRAQDIFERLSVVVAKMIKEIIEGNPKPKKQVGKVVFFKRRTPLQSDISSLDSLEKIYDYVRMLDAKTYPPAFLKTKFFVINFFEPVLKKNKVVCKAEFKFKGSLIRKRPPNQKKTK